jgi:hypothetical protein
VAEAAEGAAEIARQRAEHSADIATRLREVERQAEGKDLPAYTVLRFGIEMNEWVADWFEDAAAALDDERHVPVSPLGEEAKV